ncbi:MAG: universal stress protein [Anaerolineae bacterium]|nr:universal stress protein [Anaerolineae bacterium]
MSTHGRSGIGAWLLDRTAHAVVQLTNKPLLLIRPRDGGAGAECALKKVVVSLDGSKRAEQTLPYAILFGSACEAEIVVLRVPEIPEPDLYGHLGGAVEELRKADLIILATHGRGGMDRLMLGSVADRVVHHAVQPVLVVPARVNGPRPTA